MTGWNESIVKAHHAAQILADRQYRGVRVWHVIETSTTPVICRTTEITRVERSYAHSFPSRSILISGGAGISFTVEEAEAIVSALQDSEL